MADRVLNLEQVAARYRVTRSTIWRWRREGLFPEPFTPPGKACRWRESDLDSWEAAHKTGEVPAHA